MAKLQHRFRRGIRQLHIWVGIAAGVFLLMMGISGATLAFRPQITYALLPKATSGGTCIAMDWDRAEADVESFSGAAADRIYFYQNDPRIEFRVPDAHNDKIFEHVIYDSCSGRVLGTANLAWIDWLVDFHHNLLAGNTGRQWLGLIGISLLFCVVSGFAVWLCTGISLRRAFVIRRGKSILRPSLDLHRAAGLLAGCVLFVSSATGICLCYPKPISRFLFGSSAKRVRTKHSGEAAGSAGLNAWIHTAHAAIPDGVIREVRLPERKGPVEVRMWRRGDFRSTGDNVVLINAASARVISVDLYATAPASNRFSQFVTGLHYADWGNGLPRYAMAAAGLLLPLVLITGSIAWWLTRPRKSSKAKTSMHISANQELTRTL